MDAPITPAGNPVVSHILQVFSTLSAEEQQNVLTPLDVPDLIHLANLSDALRITVRENYYARFVTTAAEFFDDVDSFAQAMESLSAYISGSRALRFAIPSLYSNDHSVSKQKPIDLDLYVSRSNGQALCDHLVDTHGYSLVHPPPLNAAHNPQAHYRYGSNAGIHEVRIFRKGDLIVDVVFSVNEHPLFPLFFFHNTCVMNALSPSVFFSFYKTLTTKRQGLINSFALMRPLEADNYGERLLTTRAQQGITKYRQRGFDIKELPDFVHSGHPETCLAATCRLIRYSDDVDVLRLDFPLPGTIFAGRPKFPVLRWCIGGYKCGLIDDFEVYQPPFVEEL